MTSFKRRATPRALIAAASAALMVVVAGCSSPQAASDGPVTVDFWYSASGAGGEVLKSQVADFNAANAGKIKINAVYQGGYEDAMAKFSSSVRSGDIPDLMQVSDIYSGFMVDSQLTVPVSTLNTGDGAYAIDQLIPAVRNYYSVKDQLQAMPYQVSLPVLAVNTELAAAAGANPQALGDSMPQVLETASAIHSKTGKAGITFHITPWWNEEFTAAAGQLYCTPGNGVSGAPATAFNVATQGKTWETVGAMSKSGAFLSVGKDGSAAQNAFASGEAAILLSSSAAAGNLAKSSVKVSYAPLPLEAGSGGVVPGGNALWVLGKDKEESTQRAALALARFLGSEDAQVENFTASGYLPTTQAAAAKAAEKATPQQKQLLDVLAKAPLNPAAAGCHSGALNEVRSSLQPVLEAIVSGSETGAALTPVDAKAKGLVATYNERAGK